MEFELVGKLTTIFPDQALTDRFCGEISDDKINLYSFFPDEYFTCPSVCLSCRYKQLRLAFCSGIRFDVQVQ